MPQGPFLYIFLTIFRASISLKMFYIFYFMSQNITNFASIYIDSSIIQSRYWKFYRILALGANERMIRHKVLTSIVNSSHISRIIIDRQQSVSLSFHINSNNDFKKKVRYCYTIYLQYEYIFLLRGFEKYHYRPAGAIITLFV